MDFNRLLEKTVEDFLVYGKENAVVKFIVPPSKILKLVDN